MKQGPAEATKDCGRSGDGGEAVDGAGRGGHGVGRGASPQSDQPPKVRQGGSM